MDAHLQKASTEGRASAPDPSVQRRKTAKKSQTVPAKGNQEDQSLPSNTKQKRDNARFKDKNQKKYQEVTKKIPPVPQEVKVELPPIPANVKPHVVNDRIYSGCMYPQGNKVLVIDGWESLNFPVQYIDWSRTFNIKKGKKYVFQLDKYLFVTTGLTIEEMEKLLWAHCVPQGFRGIAATAVSTEKVANSKLEIGEYDLDHHLRTILQEIEQQEMVVETEGLEYAERTRLIHAMLASFVKDEPTLKLYIDSVTGDYCQKIGKVYYNYGGMRISPYKFGPDHIRKYNPSTFSIMEVPQRAMQFFAPPLPFPVIRISGGVDPELIQELMETFLLRVQIVEDDDVPNYLEYLLALMGKDREEYYLLPPENMLHMCSFKFDCYEINWNLMFKTTHRYYAGATFVKIICGFYLFRIPNHPFVITNKNSLAHSGVQLYPNKLEYSWGSWFWSAIHFSIHPFPTMGNEGGMWRYPKNPGVEIYRTPHMPDKAIYLIKTSHPTVKTTWSFIPGYYMRQIISEVACRNPDRNWMGQVSSVLSKLFSQMNLNGWAILPMTWGIYMDFHDRVGGVLFKHLYTYNPQLIAYSEARNQRATPPKFQFIQWVMNGRSWFANDWRWIIFLLLLILLAAYGAYTSEDKPSIPPANMYFAFNEFITDFNAVRHVTASTYTFFPVTLVLPVIMEEMIKHAWPNLGLLPSFGIGMFELYVYGPVGITNLIFHLWTGHMALPHAFFIHMIYNLIIYHSAAMPIYLMTGYHRACLWGAIQSFMNESSEPFERWKVAMQEWYLVPRWSYIGQLYDQAEKISEKYIVMVFDLPLQFPGALNKTSTFLNHYKEWFTSFHMEYVDPTSGKTIVTLDKCPEKFSDTKIITNNLTYDERIDRSGAVLFGMGYASMLPRRQQSIDINSWASLIEYRLQRTNTYDILFKQQVWKVAREFITNRRLYDSRLIEIAREYGLVWKEGQFRLDVNVHSDQLRRNNMLAHFDGPKKLDYIKGFDLLFDNVFISKENHNLVYNYSLIYERYGSRMKILGMAHKRDELLLKEGDIKPRPIFSVPMLTRSYTGPFLWAFKEAVYLNNYPFNICLLDDAGEYLNNPTFLQSAIHKPIATKNLMAMGATPLEMSLWFTLNAIKLCGSTETSAWMLLHLLWADGSAYDLSGCSEDHRLFSELLIKQGVPKPVAEILYLLIKERKKVIVEALKSILHLEDEFLSGMSETTIFNTLRNISSSTITLEKFKIAYAQAAGGDDYLALLGPKLTTIIMDALSKMFTNDQLSMGVTSKVGWGHLANGDFYSSMLMPAMTIEGHEVLILTLKIGKLFKSGASHSELAHTNPWDVLYDTSYVWEKITRHCPISNAIARFHKRLAISKGGRKILNLKLNSNPHLDWRDKSSIDYYKKLQPSVYHDQYIKERYNIDSPEIIEFIEFCDNLPMKTVIVEHPVMQKIAKIDLC